ncbi:MAG: hypothetical protein M3R27_14915 [Bacteroidota bacterium]|nr:hypothetical protein [Bacteroidota bacterium]
MEACLTNIIKLSQTDCECSEENRPTDYNVGQTDVYLDEMEGMDLNMVKSAEDCEAGNLWELMSWAREEATKMFKADLLACIGKNYTSKRSVYTGLIGQTTFTSSLSLSGSVAGQKISFSNIEAGYMTIRRIGLALNTSLPVDVSIYDNDQFSDTPIATYTINAVANSLTYAILSTPLELPMSSTGVSRLEYYVVYERAGFQPKDMKLDCNCGGTPPGWKQWISPKGIEGSGTDFSSFATSKKTNGIILDVDMRCRIAQLICTENRPLDFSNEGYDMQIAFAIRWKAGALLIDKILVSGNINRYTMKDREALYGARNHARKLYSDFIGYLCENKEVPEGGCLMCRPNPNFVMGEILS